VIVARKARYRSREICGVPKDQRASRIRREGDVGGRRGTELESCGAADHRASGAGDSAVDRDVPAIGPDQSGIRNITVHNQAAASGHLERSGVDHHV
jgi:hypothetical protein